MPEFRIITQDKDGHHTGYTHRPTPQGASLQVRDELERYQDQPGTTITVEVADHE